MLRLKPFRTFLRKYCQLKENSKETVERFQIKVKRLDYGDNLYSQLMLNVKSKNARLKSGLIALEGRRLIQDALKVGIRPSMIFYTRKDDIDKLTDLNKEIKIYKLPYKEMQPWSDLVTCPGIMAFCKVPEPLDSNDNSLPVTVICDQVRDPGNLGAILRCAAGAGIQKVLLMKGCVDPWDIKVLRGASGAHFHISFNNDVSWDKLPELIPKFDNFLLAVHQPSLIETPLNCFPYYKVDFKKFNNTVIVVGGEAQGLSKTVLQKAEEFNGKAINIPLSNNIDSLNCVSAMSVILFEIKRQLVL